MEYIAFCEEHELAINPDGTCLRCRDTNGQPFVLDTQSTYLEKKLSLFEAAEQALWDLKQWVNDHPADCRCYTCGDTIPDLRRSLGINS